MVIFTSIQKTFKQWWYKKEFTELRLSSFFYITTFSYAFVVSHIRKKSVNFKKNVKSCNKYRALSPYQNPVRYNTTEPWNTPMLRHTSTMKSRTKRISVFKLDVKTSFLYFLCVKIRISAWGLFLYTLFPSIKHGKLCM